MAINTSFTFIIFYSEIAVRNKLNKPKERIQNIVLFSIRCPAGTSFTGLTVKINMMSEFESLLGFCRQQKLNSFIKLTTINHLNILI